MPDIHSPTSFAAAVVVVVVVVAVAVVAVFMNETNQTIA